jgi:2-oxoisovalerate dehydrogenase E2 component (dihydrolipoyl transacylase)
MAVTGFKLPDLGEGLVEAEIVEWHVGPGDHVVADQPLLAVETDKAVVEIPSPFGGTVVRLAAEPGETVAVGALLVELETEQREDVGHIVGELEKSEPEQAAGDAAVPEPAIPTVDKIVRAMPAARALARSRGLDLAAVTGTGPDGIITRFDVESFSGAETAPGWEPFSAARKAMAQNMAAAGAQVVPATLQDWADISAWYCPDADVLLRLVRAIVSAARAEPALNAWFDAGHMARKRHDAVDLGIAVDTERGLYVPVLRDAGAWPAEDMRTELDRLITAVRAKKLTRADQNAPTITLSDFGPLGGTFAALVIRPPQVAILGAGRISERVVWGGNGAEPRPHLPLSLSFDHRAATGGEAARFMRAAIDDLQGPD